MPDLEAKLASDESSGSRRVVACRFPFPGWKPNKTVGEGIDAVWLYHK